MARAALAGACPPMGLRGDAARQCVSSSAGSSEATASHARPFVRWHAQAQPGKLGLMLANAPGTQGQTSVIVHRAHKGLHLCYEYIVFGPSSSLSSNSSVAQCCIACATALSSRRIHAIAQLAAGSTSHDAVKTSPHTHCTVIDWKIVHVEIDIGENGEKTLQMTGN